MKQLTAIGTRRWVWCAAAAGLALGFGAGAVEAQCNDCIEEEIYGDVWHMLTDEWRPLPFLYEGFHKFFQPGKCEDSHMICDAPEAIELEALLDHPQLLQQAVQENEKMIFDRERATLRVLDCYGKVTEELPLRLHQLVVLLSD